ncbi:MAG TPA: hypothetical protein DCO77_01095 [Nitrospiraceae bacterium]|nr:hypothetical protein [Nitrospiraceae bacterium]
MMPKITDDRGITITEFIITLAIIAILAAMVALSTDNIRKARVSSVTRELLADLQQARVDAKTQGSSAAVARMRGAGVRFVDTSSYAVFKFNDCNENAEYEIDTCAGSKPEEADVQIKTVPSSIELMRSRDSDGLLMAPANVLADDVRIFDRFGLPRTYDWKPDTDYILVIRHQRVAFWKCIIIATNTLREGTWDDSTKTCTEQ